MARMYTFSIEGRCPACGKALDQHGSIKVNGHEASVNDDGRVVEDEDTDLCLSDAEPNITCTYCNEQLQADAQEE
jgi:hypothetical protein